MNLFSRSFFPTLPSLGLSDEEKAEIALLSQESFRCRGQMELSEAYYLGTQVIDNLRIAVPAELEFLRTIVGWGAVAVDPYVERQGIDCFRLPSSTDGDAYLSDLWTGAGLDAELPLAVTDALSMGRGYWVVGSPLEKGGVPRVTVESPLNMAVLWNLDGTAARSALQQYWDGQQRRAALLMPGKTISVAVNSKGEWEVTGRDEHGFNFVPVERMPNQPRTNDRDGRSAITPALRSIIDGTCRTLLGLEVSREIYSVPGLILLGAAESDFQKSDGTPKAAWDTYITKILALERDVNGDLPVIQQKTAYDPSVFTKLVEMNAAQAASITHATPQDLGLYTDGNPVSAEALNTAESRRNRRARLQQKTFGVPIARVMQMAVKFDNKGALPEKFARLSVDWHEVEETSVGITTDAITKQIAAGSVPPTSDVVLKRLGYSALERQRLEQDRVVETGRQAARDIAASLIPPVPPAPKTPETPSGNPSL